MKFKIKCCQKLNDGDTALMEEYIEINPNELTKVIEQYAARAASKSYVDSFKIEVEISR